MTTNLELHLANNLHLLATLKVGSVGSQSWKPRIKNIASIEMKSSNIGTWARKSGNEPTSAADRSSSSLDSKGKGKAIVLSNEGGSRPCLPRMSFKERNNMDYTFRQDKVAKLFQQALQSGRLTLPTPTKPEQASMIDSLNYCPYHQSNDHLIEDCFPFKDWLEKVIQD